MKPFLCALALFTMLAPATACDAATAPVAASQAVAKSVALDNGLVVTPLDVPPDHVASMLNIKLWQFKIAAPKSGLLMKARLELREPGQEPVVIDTQSMDAAKEVEYTLGLMPVNGENLWNTKKIRLYQNERIVKHFASQVAAIGSSLGDRVNPWLQLQAMGFSTYFGMPNKEGDIELLGFDTGKTETPKLVLVLTTEPNPFDAAPENTE